MQYPSQAVGSPYSHGHAVRLPLPQYFVVMMHAYSKYFPFSQVNQTECGYLMPTTTTTPKPVAKIGESEYYIYIYY